MAIAQLPERKRIALVAHDHKKSALLAWAKRHRDLLACHDLFATGTTGKLLQEGLELPVARLLSGPLGGDQQLGAMIAEQRIDMLFFFWDPLEAQPHDPDVRALLRIAVLWDIPAASNEATAEFLIASPFMNSKYSHQVPDAASASTWPR